MFDLELDDVEQSIVDTGRRLALGVVDEGAFDADSTQTIDERCARLVHEFGFTCPVPEELGGAGLPTAFQQVLALETLGHGDPGVTGVLALTSASALVIGMCGSTSQRQAWLAGVAERSTAVMPLALYESYGRDPEDFETSIVAEGEGRWRVRGHKCGIAFGDRDHPHLLVIGRDPHSSELRAAVVPTDAEGVTVRHEVAPDAEQGFIALSQARFATLDVDTVVDTSDLLGEGDLDPRSLALAIARTRLLPAAITLGGGVRAREYATAYAIEREAFGTVIHNFQGVSFPLVDDQIKLDAARLSLWKAAAALDRGTPTAIAPVVNECHAAATTATRDAIQTLGGHGFLADHPVERWYRCAAMLSALDTDPLYTRFEVAV